MPIYEFKCKACKNEYEGLVRMGSKMMCPKCKSFNVKQLISKIGGIIFKGTGFYETDYKQKGL